MNPQSLVSPEDQRVTFVELFFDLVFVFSVTQIVLILHEGITLGVVARAVLVFWLVWWGWTQFTWTLNAANTDHPRVELATLTATVVAFFMAVTVPVAFGPDALWFALPYVTLRAIGLRVYTWVAADAAHRSAVRTFGSASIIGLVLVATGALVGGELQYWFWSAAILADPFAATAAGRHESWNLHPEHFAERHGLIVIIALGESLIVAAHGLAAAPSDRSLIAIGLLAVALTCAFWWSYFPEFRPALEHAMKHTSGSRQSALARDAFSLAHFPLLCGIIGVAAAIEESISHPGDPLTLTGRAALAGGLLLFVGGSALAEWRTKAFPLKRALIGTSTALAVMLIADTPPWISLAVAVGGMVALVFAVTRRRSEVPAPDFQASSV